jgi:hypothetical protein
LLILFSLLQSEVTVAQTVQDTSMRNDVSQAASVNDRAVTPTPTINTNTTQNPFKKHSNPKKAGLYAALIPGMGQVYNQQYWKLPIIYAGAGAAVYFFINNQKK